MNPVICPSVKRLRHYFKLTEEQAKELRAILKSADREDTMFSHMHMIREAHEKADRFLGFYGVETLITAKKRYYFCNTGDSYKATIFRQYGKSRFFICDWGTIAERQGTRNGED